MSQKLDINHDAIPFKDLFALLKKGRLWILLSVFVGIVVMSAYGLSNPVLFHADATFRDKGTSRESFSPNAITSLLTSGFSNRYKSEAKSLMMSRKLLERVVHKLDLQASVKEVSRESQLAQTIADNIVVEYFYFKHIQDYPIKDKEPKITIANIHYSEPIPTFLKLEFDGESQFEITNARTKESMGHGILGAPFHGSSFAFNVNPGAVPPEKSTFIITLTPLEKVVENIRSQLDIYPDPDDEAILNLSFSSPDRKLTATLLNTLMEEYQGYLKEEQERISSEQIAYLDRREMEMGKNLEKTLTSYADQLSSEVNEIGFVESEKGMEFLTKELQRLRQSQTLAELELQRLEESNPDHLFYHSTEHPQFFNNMVTKIRELDAQSDQIELALRNSQSKNIAKWQDSFDKQVQDLQDMRRCSDDVQVIMASLENGKYPLPSVNLMNHPQYMVSSWNNELNRCLEALGHAHPWEADNRKAELEHYRLQFISYLNHLQHFLEVNRKMVKERLEHQQAPQFDFQGITSASAADLYVTYSKSLNEIENRILQYQFMIDQLNQPDFEISSFSSVVDDDPIALDMMRKARDYSIAMHDDANRGVKEKERFKAELATLKKFYGLHLNQTMELAKLKELQLKGKIDSLQNAVLQLVQQQRSILENQFLEGMESQTYRIKQEQKIVAQQMDIVRDELKKLPQKWASEKFVEHQINMNARMVEELTKLVESKIISYNLEMVQSAPLDQAIAPVKPARPHLFLFAALGAILGFCLATGIILVRTMVNGFPASQENLELAGVKIIGSMSKQRDTEINIISWLNRNNMAQCAIIGESVQHFARQIASRVSSQGKKVLIIKMGSMEEAEAGDEYDTLFINETSHEACDLANELKKYIDQYDLIIVCSTAKPLSLSTEVVLDQVDAAFVAVTDETDSQLQPLIRRAQHQKLSFIL